MKSNHVFVWSSTFFAIAIVAALILVIYIQNNPSITGHVVQSSLPDPEFKLNDNSQLMVQFSGQKEKMIERSVSCFGVQKDGDSYIVALVQTSPLQTLLIGALSSDGTFVLKNQFNYASCPLTFNQKNGINFVKAGILNYPLSSS